MNLELKVNEIFNEKYPEYTGRKIYFQGYTKNKRPSQSNFMILVRIEGRKYRHWFDSDYFANEFRIK